MVILASLIHCAQKVTEDVYKRQAVVRVAPVLTGEVVFALGRNVLLATGEQVALSIVPTEEVIAGVARCLGTARRRERRNCIDVFGAYRERALSLIHIWCHRSGRSEP